MLKNRSAHSALSQCGEETVASLVRPDDILNSTECEFPEAFIQKIIRSRCPHLQIINVDIRKPRRHLPVVVPANANHFGDGSQAVDDRWPCRAENNSFGLDLRNVRECINTRANSEIPTPNGVGKTVHAQLKSSETQIVRIKNRSDGNWTL